jgi:hypothetical protein
MPYITSLCLIGSNCCKFQYNLPNICSYSYFLETFAGALEKGGVGALELVAMDMKARLVFFPDLMYHDMKEPS